MKPKWSGYLSVLAIIALIAAGGIKTQHYLDKTATEMALVLQSIKNSAGEDKWEESQERYLDFNSRWSGIRKNWILFIDHAPINNIEMKLARVNTLLKNQEQSEVAAELSEVITLLQQIPEGEKLTWHNIF